jgi:hypothetical protein
MWGARGPFPMAAAMVGAVVTPVVFCAMVTEILKNAIKTLKLVVCLSITIYCKTYCNSIIANCSLAQARVVAWREPQPLWSNGPRHIGYCQKALVIVRTILTLYRGKKNVGLSEKERKGYPHCT